MIKIHRRLSIPEGELDFQASRSSGPGGQHVNTADTRVTLRFDVPNSPSLSDRQKKRIRSRLRTRINKQGVLRVTSQKHRSQSANREAATEKFADLLRGALRRRKKRKKTKPTKASEKRRLKSKKRRGRRKKQRSKKWSRENW
ncbi:MAG: alternative ribosome rescue aminoacyl-tRNA hydrolase ArfB [Planctomycetota bacterium]